MPHGCTARSNPSARSIDDARRATALRIVCVFSASVPCAMLAVNARSASPFRYDDDLTAYINDAPRDSLYDQLKYVPLDDGTFLSFGADLRERAESANVGLLGFRDARGNTYFLHRALVYSDLHIGAFRAFVQLGDELETGRKPAAVPTDIDRLDVAQAFVDYRFSLNGAGAIDTVRAGRFEMSFDDGALIGLRDGPNVRQSWDGLRDSLQTASIQVDAFDVSPVAVKPRWFDDPSIADQRLWGLHAQTTPQALDPFAINAFFYGSTMPTVTLYSAIGEESTQTYGARASFTDSPWDGSIGLIGQRGHLSDRPVRAWSGHADAGWTFSRAPYSPRVGVRFDVLSGGDNHQEVHTFNALYPNYAFSTEATLEAPANLIQPAITADFHPAQDLTLQYKLEGLWRYSTQDAFYAAPLFPLVGPHTGDNDRFSGTEQQLRAVYVINRFFTLSTALVHFAPSAFLRSSHAVGEMFEMSEISLRL